MSNTPMTPTEYVHVLKDWFADPEFLTELDKIHKDLAKQKDLLNSLSDYNNLKLVIPPTARYSISASFLMMKINGLKQAEMKPFFEMLPQLEIQLAEEKIKNPTGWQNTAIYRDFQKAKRYQAFQAFGKSMDLFTDGIFANLAVISVKLIQSLFTSGKLSGPIETSEYLSAISGIINIAIETGLHVYGKFHSKFDDSLQKPWLSSTAQMAWLAGRILDTVVAWERRDKYPPGWEDVSMLMAISRSGGNVVPFGDLVRDLMQGVDRLNKMLGVKDGPSKFPALDKLRLTKLSKGLGLAGAIVDLVFTGVQLIGLAVALSKDMTPEQKAVMAAEFVVQFAHFALASTAVVWLGAAALGLVSGPPGWIALGVFTLVSVSLLSPLNIYGAIKTLEMAQKVAGISAEYEKQGFSGYGVLSELLFVQGVIDLNTALNPFLGLLLMPFKQYLLEAVVDGKRGAIIREYGSFEAFWDKSFQAEWGALLRNKDFIKVLDDFSGLVGGGGYDSVLLLSSLTPNGLQAYLAAILREGGSLNPVDDMGIILDSQHLGGNAALSKAMINRREGIIDLSKAPSGPTGSRYVYMNIISPSYKNGGRVNDGKNSYASHVTLQPRSWLLDDTDASTMVNLMDLSFPDDPSKPIGYGANGRQTAAQLDMKGGNDVLIVSGRTINAAMGKGFDGVDYTYALNDKADMKGFQFSQVTNGPPTNFGIVATRNDDNNVMSVAKYGSSVVKEEYLERQTYSYGKRSETITTVSTKSKTVVLNGQTDYLSDVEWIKGSIGWDILKGNSTDNFFVGGIGGRDYIDGGAGNDWIDYGMISELRVLNLQRNIAADQIKTVKGEPIDYFDKVVTQSAVILDHQAAVAAGIIEAQQPNWGDGYTAIIPKVTIADFSPSLAVMQKDVLNSIENVRGGTWSELIVGTDAGNVLIGNGGNDAIYGLGGDDVITTGLKGNAYVDGGAGVNVLDYGSFAVSLTVTATAEGQGTVQKAEGTDTYKNITAFRGGSKSDNFTGSLAADFFNGESGNDWFNTGAGNDRVSTGTGRDTVVAGNGDDVISVAHTRELAWTGAITSGPATQIAISGSVRQINFDDPGFSISLSWGSMNNLTGKVSGVTRRLDGSVSLWVELEHWANSGYQGLLEGVVFLGVNLVLQDIPSGGVSARVIDARIAEGSKVKGVVAGEFKLGDQIPWIMQGTYGDSNFRITSLKLPGIGNQAWADAKTIEGGEGSDMVDYQSLEVVDGSGIEADLSNRSAQSVKTWRYANGSINAASVTDQLKEIENLGATNGNDKIIGSDDDNSFLAYKGDDYIDAKDGDDLISTGTGNDTVFAGAGDDTIIVDRDVELVGRYLMVRKNGGVNDYLSLAELQAWSGGVNLAQDREVLSSGSYNDGAQYVQNILVDGRNYLPKNLVDGNSGGNMVTDRIYASSNTGGGWIQVDLGRSVRLDQINLFGRTDGGASQNGNYTVYLSDQDMSGLTSSQIEGLSQVVKSRHDGQVANVTITRNSLLENFNRKLIDGGDGSDTVDYKNAAVINGAGMEVDLSKIESQTARTRRLANGTFGLGSVTDDLKNIENLGATDGSDKLIGSDKDNRLLGYDGDDEIEGRGGDDVILTGRGNDTVFGGAGDDTVIVERGLPPDVSVGPSPTAQSQPVLAGRYILVRKNAGIANYLSLAELEAWSGGDNVALNRTVISSGSHNTTNHYQNNLVDGKTGGNVYADGIYASTTAAGGGWIQVDLGESKNLDQINLFGRTDVGYTQNGDYTVYVSNHDMSNLMDAQIEALPGTIIKSIQTGQTDKLSITAAPMVGRYVMVRKNANANDVLVLGELQAWRNGKNEAQNKTVVSSGSWNPGANLEAKLVDGNTGGNYFSEGIFHSSVTPEKWVQVDLGSSMRLDQINLFGRTDVLSQNGNYTVYVSDRDMRDMSTSAIENLAGVFKSRHEGTTGNVVISRFGVAAVNPVLSNSPSATITNAPKVDNTIKRIDGGDGSDTVDYQQTAFDGGLGIEADLSNAQSQSVKTRRKSSGALDAGSVSDILLNIENLGATNGSDKVIGSDEANKIWGYGGDDLIESRAGDDFIVTGLGRDTVFAGAGDDTIIVERGQELRGRYVMVRKNADSADYLSLAELQAWAGGVNVAQGKVLVSSGSLNNTDCGEKNLVDGKTGGGYAVDGIYASSTKGGGWIQVDLGISMRLDQINVFGRTDAWSDQNGHYTVYVSDQDMSGKTTQQIEAMTSIVKSCYEDRPASVTITRNTLRENQVGKEIDGGDGVDTVDYQKALVFNGAGIDVDLSDAKNQLLRTRRFANGTFDPASVTDQLKGIENLGATDGSDKVVGSEEDNRIWGYGGDDYIEARGGDDAIMTGAGTDTVYGGEGDDTVVVQRGTVLTGRYVMVRKNAGFDEHLSLAELQAWSGGVNVALGKGLVSSGSWDSTKHSQTNLVDGKTGGDMQADGIYASSSKGGGWIQVDLGSSMTLDQINLFGRTDAASSQNGNYTVYLSEQDMRYMSTDVIDKLPGIIKSRHDGLVNLVSINSGSRLYDGTRKIIDAGSGTDTVDYQKTAVFNGAGIEANLFSVENQTVKTERLANGTFGWASVTDSLKGVEKIGATEGSDKVIGSDEDNQIWGYGGDDFIEGRGGNDVVMTGAGSDEVYGGAGDDTVLVQRAAPMSRRYVMVRKNAEVKDYLVLAELQAWSGGRNLATGGTVSSSSTLNGHDINGKLIDSNIGGNHVRDGIYHSANMGGDWVQLDLGSSVRLDQINLFGRTDAWSYQNGNYTVYLSDSDMSKMDTSQIERLSDVIKSRHDGQVAQVTLGADTLLLDRTRKVIDGGTGTDMVDYQQAEVINGAGVFADLSNIEDQKVMIRRWAGGSLEPLSNSVTDRLKNVENFGATKGNDSILGSEAANRIWGYEGDDYIDGRGGDDVIVTGAGNDSVQGGSGDDTVVVQHPTAITGRYVMVRKNDGANDVLTLAELQAWSNGSNVAQDKTVVSSGSLNVTNHHEKNLVDGKTDGNMSIDKVFTSSLDVLGYIASYGDLIKAFGTNVDAAKQHYLEHGSKEGRTVQFDALSYIASHRDLINAFGTNVDAAKRHFIEFGYKEGRPTTFNAKQYLLNYEDLQNAFGFDLEAATRHFITNGVIENRTDAVLKNPAYSANINWQQPSKASWIQVDLGSPMTLDHISLFGRTGQAVSQNGNYTVYVSDQDMKNLSTAQIEALPSVLKSRYEGPVDKATITRDSLQAPPPLVGRYLMVRKNAGVNDYLVLSELQAWSGGRNLAKGGTVLSSGTLHGQNLNGKLIDDNTGGSYYNDGIYHSANMGGDWVQVDLGSTVRLDQINLFGRTDAWSYQNGNYTVYLSDQDMRDLTSAQLQAMNNVFKSRQEGQVDKVTINSPSRLLARTIKEIDGGDGTDTVNYNQMEVVNGVGIEADLSNIGQQTVLTQRQGNWVDRLRNVENLGATDGNDKVIGSDQANQIWGFDGHDYIEGRGGDDVIMTGAGSDEVYGGAGDDTVVVERGTPLTGRYVMVRKNAGVNDVLVLAEIQAWRGGVNMAQGKSVVTSSTWQGLDLTKNLVDGKTGGLHLEDGIYHSGSYGGDWVQVDLGSSLQLDQIDLFGRTDSYARSQNGNYTVYLSEQDMRGMSREAIEKLPGVIRSRHEGPVSQADKVTIDRASLLLDGTRKFIDGGDGIDMVDYQKAPLFDKAGIDVNLSNTQNQTVRTQRYANGTFGWASMTDALKNIENFGATNSDDRVIGSDQANRIWAYEGDDFIDGRGGNDIIVTGGGTDTVLGGGGDDAIYVEHTMQSVWLAQAATNLNSNYMAMGTDARVSEVDLLQDGSQVMLGRSGKEPLQAKLVRVNREVTGLVTCWAQVVDDGKTKAFKLALRDSSAGLEARIIQSAHVVGDVSGQDFDWDTPPLSHTVYYSVTTLDFNYISLRLKAVTYAGLKSLDGGEGTDFVSYRHNGDGNARRSNTGIAADLGLGTVKTWRYNDGTFNQLSVVDSVTGIENIGGSEYSDSLLGDNQNNILVGYEGADVLNGSAGNDTLAGGAGSDTYLLDANWGVDVISEEVSSSQNKPSSKNAAPLEDIDSIVFGGGISYSDLWFSKQGDHLVMNQLGTANQVAVDNWYSTDATKKAQVEEFRASHNGRTYVATLARVESLVNTLSAYVRPNVPIAQSQLTGVQKGEINRAIVTAWQLVA